MNLLKYCLSYLFPLLGGTNNIWAAMYEPRERPDPQIRVQDRRFTCYRATARGYINTVEGTEESFVSSLR
jgi:hypothetical protein